MNCDGCNAKCCKQEWIEIDQEEFDRLWKIKHFKYHDFGYLKYIDLPCPFLLNDKCSIYEQRPRMCRTFPLNSRNNSYVLCKSCPKLHEFTMEDMKKSALELDKSYECLQINTGKIKLIEAMKWTANRKDIGEYETMTPLCGKKQHDLKNFIKENKETKK
jgi:hypothetical protein